MALMFEHSTLLLNEVAEEFYTALKPRIFRVLNPLALALALAARLARPLDEPTESIHILGINIMHQPDCVFASPVAGDSSYRSFKKNINGRPPWDVKVSWRVVSMEDQSDVAKAWLPAPTLNQLLLNHGFVRSWKQLCH